MYYINISEKMDLIITNWHNTQQIDARALAPRFPRKEASSSISFNCETIYILTSNNCKTNSLIKVYFKKASNICTIVSENYNFLAYFRKLQLFLSLVTNYTFYGTCVADGIQTIEHLHEWHARLGPKSCIWLLFESGIVLAYVVCEICF
jgi:hypothetical protein